MCNDMICGWIVNTVKSLFLFCFVCSKCKVQMEKLGCTWGKVQIRKWMERLGCTYLKKVQMRKWRGWDVLKERSNESLERLGCIWRKVQWIDGKVWMYLEGSLIRRWKGYSISNLWSYVTVPLISCLENKWIFEWGIR